jgi:hypothetical protein
MKHVLSLGSLMVGTLILCLTTPILAAIPTPQTPIPPGVLGTWHSTEQFENEPRISVAVRSHERGLEGWAVLLGQHRKTDDRATLGLSFSEAAWTGQSFRFSTILPEDEGTIGWELQVQTPTRAVLVAVSVNGQSMQDDLSWEMTR